MRDRPSRFADAGRERHHDLTPVPIRRIHDRWLDRYAIRAADLPSDLKTILEINPMTSPDTAATAAQAAPHHVFATFFRATLEAIWRALTKSDVTTRHWHGSPGTTTQIADVAAGWPFVIAGLKTLLETGEPLAAS